MNKKDIAPIQRRGLRWGQLLTGLEEAGRSLKDASRGKDLLPAKDRKILERLYAEVKELEMRAWTAEGASVKPSPKKATPKKKPVERSMSYPAGEAAGDTCDY